jgi:glutaryl-CoA dehydrogenase
MTSMCKSYCSRIARENAALGGNGILIDNVLMKLMLDAEAVFTYEGTYEINSLALGRELTGLNAFN